MDKYILTIGIESHIQLKTKSKLFCSCSTEFTEEPNVNVCPICLGMPGVMPAMNEEAVKLAARAALALNCTLNLVSGFARKNYFYPDLPKVYQITQQLYPIAENGYIILASGKKVRIRRLHIEEDSGKLIHDQDKDTLVDFNRAGQPLIEIVSEPDIESTEEAVEYLVKLRRIVRYCMVSDANMELGQMRGEPNISLRKKTSDPLGCKTEIKNLNSFKAVQKGIEAEVKRQTAFLEKGEEIISETLNYNEKKQDVMPIRKKETAQEYRFFTEPDLPDLHLDDTFTDDVRKSIPELPDAKTERLRKEYEIEEADAIIISDERMFAEYYEKSLVNVKKKRKATNFIIKEIPALMNRNGIAIENFPISPEKLEELLLCIEDETVNLNAAQTVLQEMFKSGENALFIIERLGLKQSNDEGVIEEIIKVVFEENPSEVGRYRSGEEKLFGVLVGMCMKKAKGAANPAAINKKLKEMLNKEE